mgnify:FL=1
MSGYVPRRVSSTRTAMGSTDQRTAGSGSVMLGLVGSVGRRNSVWRAIQRKSYVSMRQKDCTEGKLSECSNFTISISGN